MLRKFILCGIATSGAKYMSEILANVVVSMPSQLFTLARSFKANANGKIYIGQIDTDPVNPANQIQVYIENEDGSLVPIAQPIVINAAGYPVYNGQIAKFVTAQGHSMAVYDAYGTQQFYFPNILKYDPDQFKLLLQSSNGANYVGTNHRGTLALDLDAIDRRPDGYGNSIPAVLANGLDVEIDEDISISSRVDVKENQHIVGRGGLVTVTGPTVPAFYADGLQTGVPKDNIVLNDVKIQGAVVPDGGAAYGAFFRNGYHPVVKGLDANGFTGATIVTGTQAAYLSNIHCNESWYHPSLVAGGYGVLIGQSSEWIVDGVQFFAEGQNNGRHLLYITSGQGTGTGDGLTNNVIATNLVAKYTDKDDRNMIPINMRQHRRRVLSNAVLDGANAGISYFTQNGTISDGITNNVIVNAYKYQQGVVIYGISQGFVNGYGCEGVIDSNLNIRIRLKDGATGLTGVDTVAYKVAGNFQVISSILTQVPALGYPFIFESGCNNILISDVVDVVGVGDAVGTTPASMFRFLGPCSNITIKGIKTARNMFYGPASSFGGLDNVTNLTVDFTRQVKISISSGVATKTDANYLIQNISSIAIGSSSVTVSFASHVTQKAIEDSQIIANSAAQLIVTSSVNKTLVINTYTITGAVLNPQTANLGFAIVLNS